jgi:hypothetical protein
MRSAYTGHWDSVFLLKNCSWHPGSAGIEKIVCLDVCRCLWSDDLWKHNVEVDVCGEDEFTDIILLLVYRENDLRRDHIHFCETWKETSDINETAQ